MIVFLITLLLVGLGLKRLAIYIKARKDFSHLSQITCLLAPLSTLGATLPTTWWNLGTGFIYRDRKTLYKDTSNNVVVAVPTLVGPPMVYTSSFHAFKQILAVNGPWYKPPRSIDDMKFLGENVVASEGEVWKRHRRITAPAFTQSAYEHVWKVTAGVYTDINEKDAWLGRDVVDVTDINRLTHKVALFVVAICAFGIPMSWAAPERDERGKMSVEKMVFEVSTSILARSRLPSVAYKLGNEKINMIDEAYTDFVEFMRRTISEREDEVKKLRAISGENADINDFVKDVLGRLVGAKIGEGKLALTDEEVISNCFIMMFAGHETTANTLSAALALLGFDQAVQEDVYQSIQNVLGDREPTFEDYDKLEDVLACFYEALRLYPAAYIMLRSPKEDTVLSVPRKDNPKVFDQIPLKKDTEVVLDFVGCNYNPDAFPNPEEFRPSRWTKSSTTTSENRRLNETGEAPEPTSSSLASSLDGFMGFSFGPRTCLGHKFAKVEAVCFLTNVLREWRVEVVLAEGETVGEWKERVLKPRFEVTLNFGEVPIRLVRRTKV